MTLETLRVDAAHMLSAARCASLLQAAQPFLAPGFSLRLTSTPPPNSRRAHIAPTRYCRPNCLASAPLCCTHRMRSHSCLQLAAPSRQPILAPEFSLSSPAPSPTKMSSAIRAQQQQQRQQQGQQPQLTRSASTPTPHSSPRGARAAAAGARAWSAVVLQLSVRRPHACSWRGGGRAVSYWSAKVWPNT
jgi:hypothetical protein